MIQPLDFSHLIACPIESTKEKECAVRIEEMRSHLVDKESPKYLRMVEVDKSLKDGMITFADLELDKSAVDSEKSLHWSWIFPLSLFKSIDIFELSHYLPRSVVWSKVFIGGYDELEEDQKKFASIVFDYGQACGLAAVGRQLYDGAAMGDPRAVKMYLEVCGLLGDEEEDITKHLMQVKIEI